MSRQSRFDARYWMLGAGALGRPRGMVWGGRREDGSGWGTHVYLWWIHFYIWQNQYNIVKLKKKKKEYTEELYKKDLHNQDNHNGMITHLEPDTLEYEVKWALENITRIKPSVGDGISILSFFKS